ncbi:MAG: ribonuclease Z [Firmicutes bacterium]|nr:ribonuclease Z [Bacillota bacterium]MCM1400703.1 ribonuclease Z [Bacteroides sp.]MCM1476397.1 ribonuclease Z [Bacteroides sp.]
MSDFHLTILGCGSATPTPLRQPTSQVISYRGRLMLIDCGEGAQAMLRKMGLPFSRITHVFISHMHGDHCLGLPGLLSTLDLNQKEGTVTVVLPKNGEKIMREMADFFCKERSYNLEFQPLSGNGGTVLDLPSLTVDAFPLYHRVPTYGYVFREKPKGRHLRGDMVEFYKVPHYKREELRHGADFVTTDGTVVPNSVLTTDPSPSVSYAFCSDTAFDERVARAVEGVDWLYHEATYDSSLAEDAHSRGHSTAAEAGRIAAMAHVRHLIIGHYSKRYTSVDILVEDARKEFPDVTAAYDGLQIDLT